MGDPLEQYRKAVAQVMVVIVTATINIPDPWFGSGKEMHKAQTRGIAEGKSRHLSRGDHYEADTVCSGRK